MESWVPSEQLSIHRNWWRWRRKRLMTKWWKDTSLHTPHWKTWRSVVTTSENTSCVTATETCARLERSHKREWNCHLLDSIRLPRDTGCDTKFLIGSRVFQCCSHEDWWQGCENKFKCVANKWVDFAFDRQFETINLRCFPPNIPHNLFYRSSSTTFRILP